MQQIRRQSLNVSSLTPEFTLLPTLLNCLSKLGVIGIKYPRSGQCHLGLPGSAF